MGFTTSSTNGGSPTPPTLNNYTTDGPAALPNPTISWLMEMVNEGEAFLAAQPNWDKIQPAIDAIMTSDQSQTIDPSRAKLSKTRTNRISKIAEDIAALMTDTKPFWDFSVANRRFEQHAQIYSKLSTYWYQNRSIDMVMVDVIKYYVACGTGYLHIYWNDEIGDLDACAEDPRNVIPIRPVDYKSLESCLGVIIKRQVPVNYIRDKFNENVEADSDGSFLTWMSKMREGASEIMSPVWKFRKTSKSEPSLPKIPTVPLYTCYLKDNRCNDTDQPQEMGPFIDSDSLDSNNQPTRQPATNWSYLVQPGDPLYPNRRMIVLCGNKILHDGPCFYWHGQFPLIKLTLNPYPWTFIGKAPVWDLISLQNSLNGILRVIDDHAEQVAHPGAIMDKNNVSESQYNRFNSRSAGWKVRQNPMAGKGVQIINPPPLDNAIFEHRDWIINEMDELSGKKDISRMMDLKQLPANSSIESIINQMTPGLRLRSRILEAFVRQAATQIAYGFTQFYSLTMREAILGPGGITQDDFDFTPGSLIPDYIHDSDYITAPDPDTGHPQTRIRPESLLRGPLPEYNRAKEFLRRFIFKISPASLLNSAQMERTLIYFQLSRAGVMDPITLLEQLNIPNIGVEQIPDNVRTIIDRIHWCQLNGLMMQVNPAGAKASGQEPPRIVTKES